MDSQENTKAEKDNSYEKISKTAWLTAYPRIFTDIPFSKEIFGELERRRKEGNEPEVPAELKVPRLAPELEARYKLVDRLLAENNPRQILELAAGLSPRGMIMTKDPSIEYAEIELPEMTRIKQGIAECLSKTPKNLHFEQGSALNPHDLQNAVRYFKKEEPIVVINEGLLRYLNFEEKAVVAKNIHSLLETFGGVWITPDITLKKFLQTQNEITMPGKNKTVAGLTGRNIDQNRFESEEQAKEFFENLGFVVERHSFLEIADQLTSPRQLNIPPEETEAMIKSAVVFVMKIAKTEMLQEEI